MEKIPYPVIVEGKYDKIRVRSVLDAPVFTTEGFGIFRDEKKRDLVRRLSESGPVVILTDSDRAGQRIRAALKSFCPGGVFINLYVPRIPGKERRKSEPSREGVLGVEGVGGDVILGLFRRAGLLDGGFDAQKKPVLDRSRLWAEGLLGKPDSEAKRKAFLRLLGIPDYLSTSSALDAVNAVCGAEAVENALRMLRDKV